MLDAEVRGEQGGDEVNGYSYYSDWSLVKELLKAEEGALQWLGSLSREEQLEAVKDVKMLCGLRQIPNLGPKGALELVWKVRKFQVEGCPTVYDRRAIEKVERSHR